MEHGGSLVVAFGVDALPERFEAALGVAGWGLLRAATQADLLALVEARLPAAVIAPAGEDVDTIRALPAPASGTPVIALGGEDAEALLALMRYWAGPLEDHALRAAPFGARYRLIRLLGFEAAEGMRARFEDGLREALELAARDPAAVPAHRLAGICGMVGESDLGALWARVDRGEAEALPLALQATRATLGD